MLRKIARQAELVQTQAFGHFGYEILTVLARCAVGTHAHTVDTRKTVVLANWWVYTVFC